MTKNEKPAQDKHGDAQDNGRADKAILSHSDCMQELSALQHDNDDLGKRNDAIAKANEKLAQENGELVEQLQRLQAEFMNFRSRIEREQAEQKAAAGEKLLAEFLPVVDSLQLALQHSKDETGTVKGEDLLSGLIMIMEQMRQLLEHEGLEEIKTTGERFDPRLHEAVLMVSQEGAQKGTIIQTFQRGYLRNGRVFRPAKVSVAK